MMPVELYGFCLMRDKSETGSFLPNFVIYAKNHFGKNVKYLRSDDGNELSSKQMK